MPSANWIRIVIALVALAMFGLTVLTGNSIDQQGLRWLGSVTSGITLLLLAFDRWVWKWPLIRKLTELTGARVIHGTWRGTLAYAADGDGVPGDQTDLYGRPPDLFEHTHPVLLPDERPDLRLIHANCRHGNSPALLPAYPPLGIA